MVNAQQSTNTNTITSNGIIDISNNLTLVNPFYQAKIAKVVSQRVLDTSEGFPQVELSTIQNGILKDVGNVTTLATWTNTLKSDKIIYCAGKGVITAENGEMITWIANDIGRSDDNGVITFGD
jgi:hypothetical protein